MTELELRLEQQPLNPERFPWGKLVHERLQAAGVQDTLYTQYGSDIFGSYIVSKRNSHLHLRKDIGDFNVEMRLDVFPPKAIDEMYEPQYGEFLIARSIFDSAGAYLSVYINGRRVMVGGDLGDWLRNSKQDDDLQFSAAEAVEKILKVVLNPQNLAKYKERR